MGKQNNNCPCGSETEFTQCCGKYLSGNETAPTAETLMRSRYTAYVFGKEDYLLTTWHHSTRPDALHLNEDSASSWIGLAIKRAEKGNVDDENGMVEFVARYKINGKAERLHEVSRFVKEQGKWFYVDGEHN